jgi:hypothetical protein
MGTWTAQDLLEAWQVKFGVLDPKWYQSFLEHPVTLKILEFDGDEIANCINNPQKIVEYVGIYRTAVTVEGKKLINVIAQLEDEKAARERQPLGTFSRKIEASGSLSAEGTRASIGINNNLSHDE